MKRLSYFCLVFLMLLGTSLDTFAGIYSGGDGSQTNPYKIGTIADINELGSTPWDWDSHFVMINDVNLDGATVNMIGTDWENPFTGVFDGNDHTISNFNCYLSEFQTGLFGYVSGVDSVIMDLTLENVSINCASNYRVGALVGYLYEATVVGCSVQDVYIRGGSDVGGLIGSSRYGTISNCHAIVDIESSVGVGGLVGSVHEGATIEDSYAEGTISATGWNTGGLIGYTMQCLIERCYADVSVSGQNAIGGLIGSNDNTKILNCYSTGSVSGSEDIGGLIGRNESVIAYCYATGVVIGTTSTGGLVGYNSGSGVSSYWDIDSSGVAVDYGSVGTGKTTEEMKSKSTYIGWGCNSAWTIDDGIEYPKLVWQNLTGQQIDDHLSDYILGNGNPNEPYLVNSRENFNTIGLFVCEWDKHFKLLADINFPISFETNYNMIGFEGLEFTGVFDGNNHKIVNIYHRPSNRRVVGLFGYVKGASAEIKSSLLIEPVLDYAGYDLGVLVGILKEGKIHNCHVEGGGAVGESDVGGLVARNEGGTITYCSSSAYTFSEDRAGGLAGYNSGLIEKSHTVANASTNDSYSCVGGLVGENYGTVNYCYSTGRVNGNLMPGTMTGGLVGGRGTISNSYSHARVEGGGSMNSYSGGLAGRFSTIINCYSTGRVTGAGNEGGLMGGNGSATDSFWDIETSGQSSSAGGTGAMGKTTSEMQTIGTYTLYGWDFLNIWRLCENNINYPTLSWQTSLDGDFICPAGVNFIDYSYLANYWQKNNCWSTNNCNNTDIDFSGSIDWIDLEIFCNNWLWEE